MYKSELPITLWNGSHLDGTLTITTYDIPTKEDVKNNLEREVFFTLIPQSADMSYTGSIKITQTQESIAELFNSLTYEYIELVTLFKNRELESGGIYLQ